MLCTRACAYLALLVVMLIGSPRVLAQCDPLNLSDFVPSGLSSAEDHFGDAVATNGDWVVVGAPEYDGAVADMGSVFAFRSDPGAQWSYQQQLTAIDFESASQFGSSLAIDGEWLAVSAPFRDSARGAVYMYRLVAGQWQFFQQIVATDLFPGDRFGFSSDLEGERVVLGAPEQDAAGGGSGSAYVYFFNGVNWIFEEKFVPAELELADNFGRAVAINGDRIMIGAVGDDDFSDGGGAAYVFLRSGIDWFLEDKFGPADSEADDRFGYALDFEGDIAVVSAPFDDDFIFSSGAAYAFERQGSTWVEMQKFTAADTGATDVFGWDVSMSGDYVLISIPFDDDNGLMSGSSQLFRRVGGSWVEDLKFNAPDGAPDDAWGLSSAMSGPFVVMGGPLHDEVTADAGAAYLFRAYTTVDCNGNGIEDACELAAGTAFDCNCNGRLDSCDIALGDSLDVDDDQVPDECAADCDGDGIPDVCELGEEDCNGNGVADSCDILNGQSTDCNNNGIPDECDLGLPFSAALTDCNGNLIGDPCELVSGLCGDCNGNAIPDECDLASGGSLDGNGDQVPDECQNDFLRGDSTADGVLGLTDILGIANYLFVAGTTNSCPAALDANSDDALDISDALHVIIYLFLQGSPPAAPFPTCGPGGADSCFPCLPSAACP